MKTINLEVELNFDENIYDDNEVKEVMQNVLNGIVNQIENVGVAPENSEAVTESVTIYETFTGEKVEHKF